jgi:hypothetical protein
MLEDRAICLDGERDLVKTGSQVIHESDVTSWSSVFRLLLGVTVSALVSPAPRGHLGVPEVSGRSLVR